MLTGVGYSWLQSAGVGYSLLQSAGVEIMNTIKITNSKRSLMILRLISRAYVNSKGINEAAIAFNNLYIEALVQFIEVECSKIKLESCDAD